MRGSACVGTLVLGQVSIGGRTRPLPRRVRFWHDSISVFTGQVKVPSARCTEEDGGSEESGQQVLNGREGGW